MSVSPPSEVSLQISKEYNIIVALTHEISLCVEMSEISTLLLFFKDMCYSVLMIDMSITDLKYY